MPLSLGLLVSACSTPAIPAEETQHPPVTAYPEPRAAWLGRDKYRADLRRFYGHDRYLNIFAAQIWQESLWQADAVSWVGAFGCGQFMPSTQGDAKYWARDLGDIDWGNCEQSARAAIRYVRAIYRRIDPPANASATFDFKCYAMREAIKDYNRGMGHGDRERKAGRCLRAAWACEETHTYHTRIFGRHQTKFFSMGYGPTLTCN